MACSSGKGTSRANDGGRLEQALLLRWQPIDARRQHRLHRGGDLQARQRLCQPIGPALAHQDAGLHQGVHALFQKEGVALRAGNQERREGCKTGVRPPAAPGAPRRRWQAAAGRVAVGCSTSYCPSRGGTRAGS